MGVGKSVVNVLRLPSRPGTSQSQSAHSSWRLFSSGVPVSARRWRTRIYRMRFATAEAGFFTAWASSSTAVS